MVKFTPQTYVDENFVHSAEYYSSGSTHEIRFKNASGTTLSTVNADDFIKDGMVSDVYVTTARTMVITFNTDAGHEDIELALSDIFDPDLYYTKDEIDETELAIAASLNDLNDRKADKSYVDAAVSSITIDVDSVLDTASTNPVQNKVVYQYILDNELIIAESLNDLNNRKADKSYVDAAVSSSTIDIDDHMDSASTNPVENRVIWKVFRDDERVTAAALNDLNDNKADKTYVDNAISGHTSTTIPDAGYTSSEMHLPEVTSADNGKTLRVVDGEWALVDETNVYTGSGAPSQSLGNNGDIYLETS